MGGGGLFLGSVYATMRFDTGSFDKDIRSAKTSLGGLDNEMGKATGRTDGFTKSVFLGSVAANAFTSAIGAIAGQAGQAFTALTDLEGTRASFEVLTGGAENATKAMKAVAEYANSTPFEFPTIAKAGKVLLGFGVTTEDLQKRLEQLGDVVGATGGDFSAVARVFGQISAAGKVTAEDFNQLIDNGVALGDVIAKELNIPVKDLRDKMAEGAITSEVFNRALEKATSEGGKFFGGTDKLAQTLNGRISTLTDTFTGMVGKFVGVDFSTGIVKTDGAFGKLSDTILATTKLLGSAGFTGAVDKASKFGLDMMNTVIKIGGEVKSYLTPAISFLADQIAGPLWTAVKTVANSEFAKWFGTTVVVAVNAAIYAIAYGITVISNFVTQMMSMKSVLIGAVAAITAYKVATVAYNVVGAITASMLSLQASRTFILNGAIVMGEAVTLRAVIAQKAMNLAMAANPILLVIGLVAGLIAAYVSVITTTDNNKAAQDRLNAAHQATVVAADAAKAAEDRLSGANLSAKGAALQVEQAQRAYNDALAQFGPESLEARQANYNLEVAIDGKRRADNDAKSAQEERDKAQHVSNTKVKEETIAAEAVKAKAIGGVTQEVLNQRTGLGLLTGELGSLNGKTYKYSVVGHYTTYEEKLQATGSGVPFKLPNQRYAGGPVKRNAPYFVGENPDGSLNRTSELFVPNASGRIISSRELRQVMSGGTDGGVNSAAPVSVSGGNNGTVNNVYNISLPNVTEPADFAREFRLATLGRTN